MDATLGLVMIVRDEAERIGLCLSRARRYIDAWTIVDTGSADRTPEIVEKALDGIPGTLYRRSWVNFGANRSEVFALARGTADWLLALDADMSVEIDADFEPDPAIDAHMIEMREGGTSWRLPLLLQGDLPWESRGACHEYTCLPDRQYVSAPTDAVRVTFPPTTSSPTKKHWHAGMLEEDLERDPDNPRTVFYLAQTYREMGDPRARDLYLRRAGMGGFEEERWYALYRAALLTDWPACATELMTAWEARPARLEPLHALLSEMNRHDLHRAAYLLAQSPGPAPDDLLFVDRSIWDWGMAFERSIAAWWVGERAESTEICEEAPGKPAPAG